MSRYIKAITVKRCQQAPHKPKLCWKLLIPRGIVKLSEYQFTTDWFEISAKPVWDQLILSLSPTRILEIGSYEGASACYLIDALAPHKNIELHCIDSWEGGLEHQRDQQFQANMTDIEGRFHKNIAAAKEKFGEKLDITIIKGRSDKELANLIASQMMGYFDVIYVDGSHQAHDVLCDAILSFKLLRVGGIICFDDYLWAEQLSYGKDPLRCPKLAIDAFTNIYFRKIEILQVRLMQLFVKKISD